MSPIWRIVLCSRVGDRVRDYSGRAQSPLTIMACERWEHTNVASRIAESP